MKFSRGYRGEKSLARKRARGTFGSERRRSIGDKLNATRDRALVGYYFSVACLFYAAKSWRKAKEVR